MKALSLKVRKLFGYVKVFQKNVKDQGQGDLFYSKFMVLSERSCHKMHPKYENPISYLGNMANDV